jgi:hypothetical protein
MKKINYHKYKEPSWYTKLNDNVVQQPTALLNELIMRHNEANSWFGILLPKPTQRNSSHNKTHTSLHGHALLCLKFPIL